MKRAQLFLLAFSAAFFPATFLPAQTIWQSGASTDWNAGGNWSAGVPTNVNGAVFNGTGTINNLTFSSDVGGGAGFNGILVTGGQASALSINSTAGLQNFRLSNASGITINAGAGAFSLGTSGGNIQLVPNTASTFTFQNDSSNTATLGSNITSTTGGGGSAFQLIFTGNGDWQVDALLNPVGTGGGSPFLTKQGTGTTTLTGANTYAGATDIDAGTVSITSTGFGTGSVSIDLGASVEFAHTATTTLTNNFSGAGDITKTAGGDLRLSGNNSGFSGTITLNSGILRLNTGSASSAAADWVVNSPAQLVANVANTTFELGSLSGSGNLAYSGGSVSGVIWEVGGNNNSTTYNGLITDSSGAVKPSLHKVGTGVLTLTAVNTFTGGTTVTGGTLRHDLTGRAGLNQILGNIAVGGAGTLEFFNTNNAVDNSTGLLFNTLITGSGTLTKTGSGYVGVWNTSNINGLTGNIHIMGGTLGVNNNGIQGSGMSDVTIDAGAALDIRTGGILIDELSGSGRIGSSHNVPVSLSVGNNNGSSTFSGVIQNGNTGLWVTGANTGVISLIKNGTGTQTLTGGNTYTGNTTVNNGVLVIGGGGFLYSASGASASTVNVGSGSTVNLSTTANNALGFGNSHTWIVGGTIDVSGGAAHTLPGTVTLNNGTLSNSTPGNATFGAFFAGQNRTITANGASNTISGGTRTIGIVNGATLTLDTPLVADSLLVSGQIVNHLGSTTGALSKTGAGKVTLTGGNTYTGNTTVSGGQLEIGGGGFLYSASGTSAATVNVGSSSTVTLSTTTNNALGFGNSHTWIVGGTIDVSGGAAHTLPGTVTLNNGTLSNSAPGNATFGAFFVGQNRTITANGASNTISGGTRTIGIVNGATLTLDTPLVADSLLVSGQIVNHLGSTTGALSKTGAGTVILTNNNNFTGGTTITGGTLRHDLTGRTGLNQILGNIAVGGAGTLEFFNTNNVVDNGTGLLQNTVVTGTGTITKTGAGYTDFWTGSSINGFTGNIHVMGGTLAVNNGTQGSGISDLTIDAGAAFDIRTGGLVIDGLSGAGSIGSSHNVNVNLSLGNNNGTATFNGVIQNGNPGNWVTGANTGVISLTKNGTGTQTLTAKSTFTGGTTINNGTLRHDLTGRAGTNQILGNIAIGGAGSLELFNTDNFVDNGTGLLQSTVVTGSGTITKTGAGYTDFWMGSSINGFTGNIHVMGGTLAVNNGIQGSGSSDLTLDAGTAFDIRTGGLVIDGLNGSGSIGSSHNQNVSLSLGNNNGIATFSGSIQNGNTGLWVGGLNTGVIFLTKNGTGTQTLTGANTYSGDTNVNNGVLELAGSGSLQNGNVFVNGGTFLHTSGVNNVTGAGPVNMTIANGAEYQLDGGDLDFHDTDLGNPSTLNIAAGGTFDFNGGRLLDVSTIETNGGVFQQGDSLANGGRFVVGRDLAAGQIMAEVSTINGGYTQLGGVLALDIFGQLENEIDMLVVNGDVTMNGSIDANVNGVDTIPFQWYNAVKTGDGFDITLGGTFNVNGFNFRVIDDPNGLGRILQIAVPEPASVLLWGLLAAGLGLYARRRRKAKV